MVIQNTLQGIPVRAVGVEAVLEDGQKKRMG
jgi:hypothetical protein